jgi:hypothetical protein
MFALTIHTQANDKLKNILAHDGIILLDVTGPLTPFNPSGHKMYRMNIVFAIDKGYGYSQGPFKGAITFTPIGNNGDIRWFEITYDPGPPFDPIYISNPHGIAPR